MKKRRIKKGMALMLCIAMLAGMVPPMPFAPETVSAAAEQPKIFKTGTYTLKDVEITGGAGQSAVAISGNVTLKIEGTVKLTGGAGMDGKGGGAGIEVPQGSSLTLSGSGTLYATGGKAGDGAAGSSAGKGGGGAGAGIGSRGADNATSSNVAGTVTIKDKNLFIEARGGGSGKGGKGEDGEKQGRITEYDSYELYGAKTTIKTQGGSGGRGGGGGGYAAAGIGSGGAAGGNGGAGGDGSTDSTSCTVIPIITSAWTNIVYPGWCQVTGGGGGGGGAGAQSGGGGGAGGALYGELDTEGKSYKTTTIIWTDLSKNAKDLWGGSGGEPGHDGASPETKRFLFNSNWASSGTGGMSTSKYTGGAGGAGGDALDGEAKAQAGGAGQSAGKRASAGLITLAGGTVYAYGGGGAAQNIGSGDGSGSASGSLVIRGGNLPENGNTKSGSMLAPTNGQQAVYPAVIKPWRFDSKTDMSVSAGVTVNGADWNASIYKESSGAMTIWLPESNSDYTVKMKQPVESDFAVTVKNKKATVKQSGEVPDVALNLDNGSITLGPQSYTQGSISGALSSSNMTNGIMITGGDSKKNITCQNGTKLKLILQNATIGNLIVSNSVDKKSEITVECVGVANEITWIQIDGKDSKLIFEGDAESRLDVHSTAASTTPYTQDVIVGKYISDLVLTNTTGSYGIDLDQYIYINGNLNPKGKSIYLGYNVQSQKSAGGKDKVVRNLIFRVSDAEIKGYQNGETYTYNSRTYYPVPIKSGSGLNGDLNQGAGGKYIYLYYTKDTTVGTPITGLQVLTTSSEEIKPTDFCETCCDGYVYCVNRLEGGKNITYYPATNSLEGTNLNEGAKGGACIRLALGRKWDDTGGDWVPAQEKYQQGQIVMNSKGKVSFGTLSTAIYSTMGPKIYTRHFFGSPTVEVNNGCLQIGSYLEPQGSRTYITTNNYIWWYDWEGEHWWSHGGLTPNISNIVNSNKNSNMYYDNILVRKYTKYEKENNTVMGSNTMGNITVNGGTLQMGSDGDGKITEPNTSLWGSETKKKPTVSVTSGGNLLSSDFSSYLSSGDIGKRTEITGLAPNSHMSLIMRTDNDEMIGDYTNQDIWTNANGNFITYLRAIIDYGNQLVFADEEGYAYVYKMTASSIFKTPSPTKVTLNKLSTATLGTYPLRLHPHYAVHKDQIYGYDEDRKGQKPVYTLKQDVNVDVLLADNADIKLKTNGHHSMKNVTGVGSLTLDQADLEVKGQFNVSSLEVLNGSLTTSGITGAISVKGGSVKTDKPIIGATGKDDVPVYQAIIPAWPEQGTEVTVDGNSWNVTGNGHGDGNTYLYVPQNAKDVFINGRCFRLSFNSETQTMDVCERLNGDGKIDLSLGSATILDDDEYIWNGQLYLNTNKEVYEVTGESNKNTLTVLASDKTPKITLKDVSLSNAESPILVAEGKKADILLEGTNTLTGGESYPAIHVPQGAEVSIGGYGILNAGGGIGAAAVGGAFGEVNGTIRINGGTWNLTTSITPAVGAGDGADTPEGSLIVTGGSIKTAENKETFAVTPVNEEKKPLSRVIIENVSEGQVLVNEKDFQVKTPNDDGNLYLYLVSDTYTIQVGTDEYMLVPLNLADTENGEICLWLETSDGTETKLSNGDMVLEGSCVRINTKPDSGYGLRTGPDSGIYTVERENGTLVLKPAYGMSGIDASDWNWEVNSYKENKYNDLIGCTRSIEEDSPVTLDVGIAREGDAVLSFSAEGEGIKVDILVDGEVKDTVTLKENSQDFTYEWKSDGTEAVALRFSGKGDVMISSAFLSNKIEVSQVIAEFEKAYTIYLDQPEIDDDADNPGVLELLDENREQIKDRNLVDQGTQVFEGQYVMVRFWDPDGGSIFDKFILKYENETSEEKTENPLNFTMGTEVTQDVTISAESHLDAYYEVVLPERVLMSDEGAESEITAVAMKHMEKEAFVKVSISGLDNQGNAVLKRIGDENTTLTVPVYLGEENQLLENDSIVARFMQNKVEPEGGKIRFGVPGISGTDSSGWKKAGKYEGSITFVISYEKQGK